MLKYLSWKYNFVIIPLSMTIGTNMLQNPFWRHQTLFMQFKWFLSFNLCLVRINILSNATPFFKWLLRGADMLGDNFICLGESHVGNSIYWESFYPISFEKYWKISLIYVLCIEIMTYANYGNFSIVVFGISLFFTRFIILMTILSTSKFDQSDATSYMIKHLIIHNLSCAHIK